MIADFVSGPVSVAIELSLFGEVSTGVAACVSTAFGMCCVEPVTTAG